MSISEEYLAIKIDGQFYEKNKSEILLADPGEEVDWGNEVDGRREE